MRNHWKMFSALAGRATALGALLLAGACSEERVGPPPPVPTGTLMAVAVVDASADIVSAKERALAENYAEAIASAGFAKLNPLLDDDAHFMAPGMDDKHYIAGVIQAHELLFGAFDDRKLTETRVWRTPNEQTIEWTFTGTQARTWAPSSNVSVPAQHKPVVFKGLTLLWTKDDGSITDVHVYTDFTVPKAQLGAAPKDFPAVPVPPLPTGAPQVVEQTQTGSAVEANNVVIARGLLDALENNNEAGYLASVTDDVQIDTLEQLQPARGKDAARAYYKAMRKAVGQLDTTVKNAWGAGAFAIVEYTIGGEQLGSLGWIPAQRDQVIRMQIVDVEEIRDGKVAHIWRYDYPAQIIGGV